MSSINMSNKIRKFEQRQSMLIGIASIFLVLLLVDGLYRIGLESTAFLLLFATPVIGGFTAIYMYGRTEKVSDPDISGAKTAAIGTAIAIIFISLIPGGDSFGEGIFGGVIFGAMGYPLGYAGSTIAHSVNSKRLKRVYQNEFQTEVNNYSNRLSEVEKHTNKEDLDKAGELLGEASDLRSECERLKDIYDISTSLFSENQRYAKVAGDVASYHIQSLVDEAERDVDNNNLDDAIEKLNEAVENANLVEQDAEEFNVDVDLPVSSEEAKIKKDSVVVQQRANIIADLVYEAERDVKTGNISKAKSKYDDARGLLDEVEDIESKYGSDISVPTSLIRNIDQEERRIVEDRFESLLDEITAKLDSLESAIENENYERGQQLAGDAFSATNDADVVASHYDYISEAEVKTKLDTTVSKYTEAISNQIKEINEQICTRDGQDRAAEFEEKLIGIIDQLESLHTRDISEDAMDNITIAAGKAQNVLLATRLLIAESNAKSAKRQYENGNYESAKETFENTSAELNDIRDTTLNQALKEYESELEELLEACETNSERARKLNLGLESDLSLESVSIVGPSLRAEAEAQSTGDTEVYEPGDVAGGQEATDTKIFSSEDVGED